MATFGFRTKETVMKFAPERSKALPFILPSALLGLWITYAEFWNVESPVLVSPLKVFSYTLQEIFTANLYLDLFASLARYASGLVIGSGLGLVAGISLGTSPRAEKLFGASFNGLKQVAIFAWIPLLTLWFGLNEPAKVAFIALSAFYPMASNSLEGVRGVRSTWIELARTLNFKPWQILVHVILPASAPALSTGLNLAMIYAWLGTIGAEYFLASGWGIGHSIIEGREHFKMEQVIFGIIMVSVMGYAQSKFHHSWEQRFIHWNKKSV
jgi:sulfonate transport system permease protein